uniref:Plakophilin 4 n=1 Tax=Mesocestoides corti TaxID=53468 RepID=A0A5K3FRU0_MESCO
VSHYLSQQNVSATLPVESFQDQLNPDFTPHSCTFGPQHSRSLHASARHPFSEYGRFYNLSYASIADQPSRRSTDAYRRNGLHTPATSNSTSHVQHFHIPQGKRFSLEPNRIIPAGMSRISRSFNSSLRNALANMNELVIRKVVPVSSQYASTGILYSSPRVASNISNKRSTLNENLDASLEARRLASFPSGQPPDETFVPAIERYDWPAPASTAVMTSEMMRERRQRLREQGVLHDNSEESIEDLSIDASVGSHSELDRTSGIERVSFCSFFAYLVLILASHHP